VLEAFRPTRGQILTHGGEVCDARFSKCCGGVTEDFRVAWADTPVPYLVPVADTPERRLPEPPLTSEKTFRAFLEAPSTAHCSCRDERILKQVLPSLDQRTADFFRWQVRLTAEDATRLTREKGGLELGRIVALVPLARGLSGRIWRLRIRGESGECIVGKELEVRRLLSRTHLLSAAFVVDPQGPAGRPEAFVLSGAGWGHGVGLCQIGAAVLAARGRPYAEILAHYYPGTGLTTAY
jgi:SpoIID/LytB domain protein